MTPLEIYEATQEHWRDLARSKATRHIPYFRRGRGPWWTDSVPPMAREELGVCIHIGDPNFKFPYES